MRNDYVDTDRVGIVSTASVDVLNKWGEKMSKWIDADALTKEQWWVEIQGENIDDIAEQIIRQCKDIVRDAPSIKTKQIKYYDEPESVWKIGEVIVDEQMD